MQPPNITEMNSLMKWILLKMNSLTSFHLKKKQIFKKKFLFYVRLLIICRIFYQVQITFQDNLIKQTNKDRDPILRLDHISVHKTEIYSNDKNAWCLIRHHPYNYHERVCLFNNTFLANIICTKKNNKRQSAIRLIFVFLDTGP